MGFPVELVDRALVVHLSGLDLALNWRRRVELDVVNVSHVLAERRGALEEHLDHRACGSGTHDGSNRPNRRRVGTMLGRDIPGKQFWAVRAGPASAILVVLELRESAFVRAVLMVDDPGALVTLIDQHIEQA